MITDEQCVDAYKKHEQLFAAADELGIHWQTLYSRLKRVGCEVVGNKSKWGSSKDRFAARGEEDFAKLVPEAENQNAKAFQPKVDFVVNGAKVDVKSAKPRASSHRYVSTRWAFSLSKQLEHADFYVLLCYDEKAENIQKCYLIPRDLIVDLKTISIPVSGKTKWGCFEVEVDRLRDFFKEV